MRGEEAVGAARLLEHSGKNPQPALRIGRDASDEIVGRFDPVIASLAQEIVDLRWKTYEDMATLGASSFQPMY